MKIVFIGNVLFSYFMLKTLISLKCDIKLVITTKKNLFNSDYYNLTPLCKNNNIKVITDSNLDESKLIHKIKEQKPDYIFCIGWSKILSKKILSIPTKFCIGYHPSDLPHNRGRHPIIWAKALGLTKTASCFFKIDEGIDTGDIISKKYVMINKKDDSYMIYKKLVKVSKKQVTLIINDIRSSKKIFFQKQKINSNSWRKRNINDGKIDWRMNASSIDNLIKSLNRPYPGAHFFHKNNLIKVWESKVIKNKSINIEPGKVVSRLKNNIIIKCGTDSIKLIKYNPQKVIKESYIINE
jgi:methionyl-tRNA formyltransferase